jgi:hypothetical protein
MREMGIEPSDLSNIPLEEELDTHKHPLYQKTHELAMQVSDWITENQDLLKRKAKIVRAISEKTSIKFLDAIEVIQWYNFFIAAKIFRALPHMASDLEDEASIYDSNGSAKIALIAIDRSIASWGFLLEHLTVEEDQILHFLQELSGIKSATEKQFPDAYKFIRPGFDEP